MNATNTLMGEHRVIEQVLAVLEEIAASAERDGVIDTAAARDALDFFRTFADGCHHAKEERHLFPLLESRGLPREGGPTGVMLHEHDQGRTLTRAMDAAVEALAAGRPGAAQELERAARQHVQHLRQHIAKENQVLFPMARQLLAAADLGALQEPCRAVVEAVLGPQREAAARAEVASLAEESQGNPVAV